MANSSVQNNLADSYLQKFDLPIGVSGMQKLQQFPALQQLGHAGQLSFLKNDFHGLADFKQQMDKYSSSSLLLKIAWSLIKSIVPNNPNIARMLTTIPGLGTVGQQFLSISGFGKVFSLSPGDLTSPAAVAAKASIYQNASTSSNTTQNSAIQGVGGGAGISSSVVGSTTLEGLTDVSIIGVSPGQVLSWNGTKWVNININVPVGNNFPSWFFC